jgi:hypothetical protein
MDDEQADEARGEPEIHAVPVSLNPAKTEGFALLPEDAEDAPAAVNVPGVERAIAFLRERKKAAAKATNFEDAARLREMEFAVNELLAWYRASGGS